MEIPRRIEKPWGHEVIWASTDRYVGKILHINRGHQLSLQYHNRKDETIHVLTGEIICLIREDGKDVEHRMRAGESCHIPPGTVHRFEAVPDSDLWEASPPELDDLIRLQDQYGRAG